MLLTITTTYQPATDLGYLLHKHPERVQSFSLSFGRAHVFYPEASEERCTAALLLDSDPISLVRGRHSSLALEEYVNDRPYVASSFLSVAISEVFGTALGGRGGSRQALAETKLPFQATLAVLPCRGGEGLLKRLFEPLGYTVTAIPHMLDEQQPDWGNSPYFTVTLEANCRLSDLLTHLYVLVPVLDDEKHYWIGDDEVEKLLRRGKGWLETHPEREQISYRYLKHKRDLTRDAIARLVVEDSSNGDSTEESAPIEEEAIEKPIGASGSGKSTFARKHFKPTEVLSSDFCRGLVSDDENDQAASNDAFAVLHFIAAKRLAAGRLTVIDATNVEPESRKPLMALARQYHCLPVAIVFNLPEKLCHERNQDRPDRNFGPHVVRRQTMQLRRSLHSLQREGFQYVFELSSPQQVAEVEIERQPLWNNLKHEHGPFDIIGDVHGCFDELCELLKQLGYTIVQRDGDAPRFEVQHP